MTPTPELLDSFLFSLGLQVAEMNRTADLLLSLFTKPNFCSHTWISNTMKTLTGSLQKNSPS